VLARHERVAPDAAASGLDQLAVLVLDAREVVARVARVAGDDADEAHLDDRLRNELDGGEQTIEVIRALDEDVELTSAPSAGGEERLRVLERLVGGRTLP